ncbi:MAG: hypothetical protein M5U28_13890 [Sandaracinaceae bacterium]|nr:hypothetical protein [Sandaracinaceae bacterium]
MTACPNTKLWRIANVLLLASCGAPTGAPQDATRPDGSAGATDAALTEAGTDGGSPLDAATPRDAAGAHDAGTVRDAGFDAAPLEDAAVDSSVPLDADMDPVTDASADAGPTDAGTDAGPPSAPVGAAVDVTGSRCALDSVGNFWCWGRWTPVEDVRLLGAGFTSAAGSCALRGREVWCAEFTTLTMLAVIDGSSVLEVNSIAEYSDLHRGCGWRPGASGWGEAVCWQSRFGGWDVAREGGTGSQLVAVRATEPRMVAAIAGPYEAYDINPPAYPSPTEGCRSNGVYVDCGSLGYGPGHPAGDHFILGFAMACAHNAGSSTCSIGYLAPSWTVSERRLPRSRSGLARRHLAHRRGSAVVLGKPAASVSAGTSGFDAMTTPARSPTP